MQPVDSWRKLPSTSKSLAQISGAVVTSDAGYTATFNGDYDKILVYDGATQVTAATNLSGVTFTVVLLTADVA